LFLNQHRCATTLIGVLTAFTATLLVLGSLAQAFKYLGDRIEAGRPEVRLNSEVRAIAVALRDDLRRATAPLKPPHDSRVGSGYFMMVEGPMSDATSAILGQQPSTSNERAFFIRKWGDIDDYLAFTVQALPGNWFTGKVPRFIVEPHVVNDISTPLDDRFEPVQINSQYAEVIYWLSPRWERDGTLQGTYPGEDARNLAYGTQGLPVFSDVDGNGIPDELILRRRVLLIRPDLNLPNGSLPIPNGHEQGFWFQSDMSTAPRTRTPYRVSGWQATPPGVQGIHCSNWFTGMQLAYQLCDLSIGRRINYQSGGGEAAGEPWRMDDANAGTVWIYPTTTSLTTGNSPETGIQANSLTDLARPHFRFGHVRVPGDYFDPGYAVNAVIPDRTTMPLVALTGADPAASSGWSLFNNTSTPHLTYPRTRMSFVDTTSTSRVSVDTSLFNGFLLPHFQLSNYAAHSTILNDDRWDRTGEDILADGVIGFDLQGFDPQAPVLLINGADGQPGVAGVDDNLDNTVDNLAEQGAAGTDDTLVTPDDPEFYFAFSAGTINPSPGIGTDPQSATLADRGAFVDLGYAGQAGGNLRDYWRPNFLGRMNTYLQGPLSGYESPLGTNLTQLTTMHPFSFRASGRTLILPIQALVSPSPSASQPGQYLRPILQQVAYDTATTAYESDGFYQQQLPPSTTATAIPRRELLGTWWMLGSGDVRADRNLNGLDDPLTDPGEDEASEHEVSPPIPYDLRGIRVRIRLEDIGTRQFKQMAVIHDFVN
jgi:hypothetical protein